MATKKSLEEVIAKEMPGFRVVKKSAADTGYAADAVTPSLETMHKKYKMASPRRRSAGKSDSRSKSQMVVVESGSGARGSDTPIKRLTVSVKDGKVRARQG